VATWKGHTQVVDYLIRCGADVHAKNTYRNNQQPLHLCVIKNRHEILELLLANTTLARSKLSELLSSVFDVLLRYDSIYNL
jgi:ankyrin repeat protein